MGSREEHRHDQSSPVDTNVRSVGARTVHTDIRRVPRCGAGAGATTAPELAQPSRPSDRAVPAGRRSRHDRPHRRRPALRHLGSAGGDREQGRRRRQSRGRGHRPFRPRRLHHVPRGRLSGDELSTSPRSSATIPSPTSCPSRSWSFTPSSWWCRTPRRLVRSASSSPTPRPILGRSPLRPPAMALRPISPRELFKRTAGIELTCMSPIAAPRPRSRI